MKKFPYYFIISLAVAIVLTQIQMLLESNYITAFLKQNLIILLVALLAINCTTLGIVLTKIRELIDHSGASGETFKRTRKEMVLSINEQIALIGISLLLLLIQDSKWLQRHLGVAGLIEVLIIAGFVFGIIILYDTAKSVFVILEYKVNGEGKN